jgi:hypothetical protein
MAHEIFNAVTIFRVARTVAPKNRAKNPPRGAEFFARARQPQGVIAREG